MTKSTAVVILNWNGRKHLETFLPSVVNYSLEADVILADNASTDDSLEFVKVNFPSVLIMQNQENEGFAKGYNTFINQLSQYSYFVLLNNDVEVTENWLKKPIEIFETQKEVGAIQPKILSYLNKKTFEYAGAAGGFIDAMGYPYCRGRVMDTVEEDLKQYDTETEIFWASGAAFFVRKEIYRDLGGLDEDFFAHMEEIDFSWRIWNAGYKILYTHESVVYHLGGGSLSYGSPKKTYLNFRNSLVMLLKNLEFKKLYLVLFRMILDGVAFLKFLIGKEPKHSLAILKAHVYIYSHIIQIMQKREKEQAKLKMHAQNMKPYSIIWNYFVRKKTKFIELH